MFTVLEQSFGSKQSLKSRQNFLDASYENVEFFGQADITSKAVATKVKTLLQSHKTSYDGVLLLDCYLGAFPTSVVHSDTVFWTRSVLHLLSGKRNATGQRAAWCLLERLLHVLPEIPDQGKEAASLMPSLMEKVFAEISAPDREPEEGALRCLLTCMKDFGKLLGSVQDALEKILMKLLITWHPPIIQELVCECVALLPGCRRGGPKGSLMVEAWTKQMQRLLAAAQVSLDRLFNEQGKSRVSPEDSIPLDVSMSSEDSHQATLLCWKRSVSLIRTVGFMLGTRFQKAVMVPIDDILRLLNRVLGSHVAVINSGATIQASLVAAILPSVQYEAVQLLCQLVQSCRQLLIRHAGGITDLIVDALLRAKQDTSKDLRRLRQACYKALWLWLQTCRSAVGLQPAVEKLVPLMLHDVEPLGTSIIQLSSSRNSVLESQKESSKMQDTLNPEIRAQLCEHALEALRSLISVFGTMMAPDVLQEVQRSVLVLVFRLQQATVPAQPYRSPQCRRALYSLLLALATNHNVHCPPPLHCIVRVFSTGLNDASWEVVDACSQGLSCCTLTMHPQVTGLARPLCLNGDAQHWRRKDVSCQTPGPPAATSRACQTAPSPTPTPMPLPRKRAALSQMHYPSGKRPQGPFHSVYRAASHEEQVVSDEDEDEDDYMEMKDELESEPELKKALGDLEAEEAHNGCRTGSRSVNGQGPSLQPTNRSTPIPKAGGTRLPTKFPIAEYSSEDEVCSDEEDYDDEDEDEDDLAAGSVDDMEQQGEEADLIEIGSDGVGAPMTNSISGSLVDASEGPSVTDAPVEDAVAEQGVEAAEPVICLENAGQAGPEGESTNALEQEQVVEEQPQVVTEDVAAVNHLDDQAVMVVLEENHVAEPSSGVIEGDVQPVLEGAPIATPVAEKVQTKEEEEPQLHEMLQDFHELDA